MTLKQIGFWCVLLVLHIKEIGAKEKEPPRRIHVYGSEAIFDFRLNHTLAVVNAALDVNADTLEPMEVHSTGGKLIFG